MALVVRRTPAGRTEADNRLQLLFIARIRSPLLPFGQQDRERCYSCRDVTATAKHDGRPPRLRREETRWGQPMRSHRYDCPYTYHAVCCENRNVVHAHPAITTYGCCRLRVHAGEPSWKCRRILGRTLRRKDVGKGAPRRPCETFAALRSSAKSLVVRAWHCFLLVRRDTPSNLKIEPQMP